MNQRELKTLLEEASRSDCSGQRRAEIRDCLIRATVGYRGNEESMAGGFEFMGREAGLLLMCDAMYIMTIQNRPELLPSLFPAFAILCGDRGEDDSIIADVDWTI